MCGICGSLEPSPVSPLLSSYLKLLPQQTRCGLRRVIAVCLQALSEMLCTETLPSHLPLLHPGNSYSSSQAWPRVHCLGVLDPCLPVVGLLLCFPHVTELHEGGSWVLLTAQIDLSFKKFPKVPSVGQTSLMQNLMRAHQGNRKSSSLSGHSKGPTEGLLLSWGDGPALPRPLHLFPTQPRGGIRFPLCTHNTWRLGIVLCNHFISKERMLTLSASFALPEKFLWVNGSLQTWAM